MLQRLANSWERRTCVKQPELDSEALFDDSKDDFLLNRLTVDTHRRDALAHGSLFKGLAKCMYRSLNSARTRVLR